MQLDQLTRPPERLLEPLVVEWLNQIVDRGQIEGRHRVIIRRREDYRRHRLRADLADDLEPRLAGHLNVEKDEIRLQLADCCDGIESVVGAADDLDVALVGEQILEPLSRETLVVGDQYPQQLPPRHALRSALATIVVLNSARLRNGIVICATVPPFGDSARVNTASIP